MAHGFVYLLGNDSFNNLYKIGYTFKSPHQRASELSNTSSPNDFYVLIYAATESPSEYESAFHHTFAEKRVNQNREFFDLSIDDIKEFLRSCRTFSNEVITTHDYKELLLKNTKDEK